MTEIRINPNDPESIRRALNTEWLLTNGLGGYAMGTALGVNTRRYHGLLVAATKPPVGRIVALHSMIEQLVIPRADGSEEIIDLSTQQFVGPKGHSELHPSGWKTLSWFHNDPELGHSRWHWRIGDIVVSKMLEIDHEQNAVKILYGLDVGARPCRLRTRPLLSLRSFHDLTQSAAHFTASSQFNNTVVEVATHEFSLLMLALGRGEWRAGTQVWHNFAYAQDAARGQSSMEEVWTPGYFEFELNSEPHNWGSIQVRLDRPQWRELEFSHSRRPRLPREEVDAGSPRRRLEVAARAYPVRRIEPGNAWWSVIAGYPWFGDWGRDTMIALPGLMLCTGRFEEASSTLLTFARHLRNGLIPNLFDDYGGAAHYNTVDASLWFVHAVHELWRSTPPPLQGGGGGEGRSHEPKSAARSTPTPTLPLQGGGSSSGPLDAELLTACRTIIAAYTNGTDFNIRLDEDGLIAAGDENSQLTWMDAKRDGVVFTPRHGKAVEINALWFNALRCLAEMTDNQSERDALIALSENVSRSFREKFWWRERACLHDVLVPRDATSRNGESGSTWQLRPNQIFAVSLPFSPLDENQQRAVVKIVGDRLLTPYGLRTLDRDDPHYRGRYEGNLFERDAAYHNGTVWPWLIGPYCEALLRINTFSDDAKSQVKRIIQPLLDELENTEGGRCVGQLAEVYDGDSPQRPNGCPAQAWSVAEVLRVLTLIEGG